MKTPSKILLLLCLINPFSSIAQNPVPNSGFETWIHYGASFEWDDPQEWDTPNEQTAVFNRLTVVPDSNPHTGILAAKLKTWGNPTDSTSIWPGVLCAGTLDQTNRACQHGFPMNFRFGYFSGYYKYSQVENSIDSGLFSAVMWRWDGASSSRDTVATAEFHCGQASNYTPFGVPFSFKNTSIPDSAVITIISTKTPNNAPIKGASGGSILLVDDIAFSGSVGMEDITQSPLKLSPDPADQQISLQAPPRVFGIPVNIFDFTGRLVKRVDQLEETTLINVSELSSGLYFICPGSGSARRTPIGKFVVEH